ncbi:MAG: DUF5317 family protein [Patescibacteria group bacterium]
MLPAPRLNNPYALSFLLSILFIVSLVYLFSRGLSNFGFFIFTIGLWCIFIGGVLNTLVIAANKRRMPAYIPPGSDVDLFDKFLEEKHSSQHVMFQDKNDPEIRFKMLADRLRIGPYILSLGDLFWYSSVIFFILHLFFVK